MATGGQWDVTQVVAWSRMFTGYAQEMTLSAAATKTFSGEMCGLCRVVQEGKREQTPSGDATPAKAFGKMLDLVPLTETAKVLAPVVRAEVALAAASPWQSCGRATPPLPPPRV